ncbi:MAG TPA: DoxX family protein [Rhizomicrobium sp.]
MLKDMTQIPQLAIRPVAGLGMMYHAAPVLFTSAGYANFVHQLTEVGLPWPQLSAALVAGLEFVGGLGVLLGAFTVFFSFLLALELSTRVLVIFLKGDGFPPPLPGQMPLPDYETNLFYILFFTALVIAGGGKYALDRLIWAWEEKAALKS